MDNPVPQYSESKGLSHKVLKNIRKLTKKGKEKNTHSSGRYSFFKKRKKNKWKNMQMSWGGRIWNGWGGEAEESDLKFRTPSNGENWGFLYPRSHE